MKSGPLLIAALVATLGIRPAVGQGVTARTGTVADSAGPESIEVASPMVVEVEIPPWRPSVRDRSTAWSTKETAKFVCDKARVQAVQVTRAVRPLEMRKGPGSYPWPKGAAMALEVTPTLTTEWFRQDVDLTITVTSGDGSTQLGKRFWNNLTIGVENAASKLGVWGSSSSKKPMLVVGLTEAQVERFESEGLRASIVMAIHK